MNKDYYIVTGASGSIGEAIAEALAQQGLPLILACRNMAKSEPVRQQIIEKTGNTDVELLTLDLASIHSILHFGEMLTNEGCSIKALINNAGVMCKDFGQTTDGFETTVGVNYIGTVLLTQQLIPLMHPGSRIVTTTSLTRYIGKIEPSFFDSIPHGYKRFKAYSKSKLALTLYTARLAQELQPRGIAVNAADPGIVDSDMITMHSWVDPLANLFFRPFISTPQQGAISAISAASFPDSSKISGEIFNKKHHSPIPASLKNSSQTLWLWNETEKLVAKLSEKTKAQPQL